MRCLVAAAQMRFEMPKRVPDWGGGTRIGEALRTFNVRWARRVLAHGPVVLVIPMGGIAAHRNAEAGNFSATARLLPSESG